MKRILKKIRQKTPWRKRQITITAKVIRADGTVEDIGVVAEGDLELRSQSGR